MSQSFCSTFVDQHDLVLPGRVHGFARDDLRVLPSHLARKAIWQLYDTAVCPLVILRAFCQLWKQLLPSVVVTFAGCVSRTTPWL